MFLPNFGRLSSSSNMIHASSSSKIQGNENEVELMRTILGEHVPQSVILTCLNACGFDVSAALNWYFAELAATQNQQEEQEATRIQLEDHQFIPFIRSGLSLTLHPRNLPGMLSKTDTYYATLTRGLASYDVLTPSNEKFYTIRLRKRGWCQYNNRSSTSNSLFSNGDIVTVECNGLWLKVGQLNKMLQWKAPSDDDRHKFVIRGLPLGRNLRAGDYFFLQSLKHHDREVVMKDEKPVGMSSYNTSVHRCFLALERIKTPTQRLFFYAKFTEKALETFPRPDDPLNVHLLSISVHGKPMNASSTDILHQDPQTRILRKNSISDEISIVDAKIDQMMTIIGADNELLSRDVLACFLDGAGGDVQVALEHYFMSHLSTSGQEITTSTTTTTTPVVEVDESTGVVATATATTATTSGNRLEGQIRKNQRPLSQLILPVPAPDEPFYTSAVTTPKDFVKIKTPIQMTTTNTPTTTAIIEPKAVEIKIVEEQQVIDTLSLVAEVEKEKEEEKEESKTEQEENQVEQIEEGLTIQDFEMISVLGKGSFGAVMLVRFKKDGRVFAIKILKKTNMDKNDILNAMEERQILQRINHPYICGLMFAFQTDERLYLGMKYYAAGDLFYHLNMKGRMSLRDARLYAAELVLAISYLHELNILYRDLKPSNIMIDDEGHIGVVDFGLSKQHIYGSNHGVKTLSGTAEYVAPEALTQSADGTRNYGKAYDWWSLGVVLYEMLVGESPFYDENEHKMLHKIVYSNVKFPKDFPREALDLVRGLLAKDPSKRLGSGQEINGPNGLNQIKQNVFFQGKIDWEKLAKRQVKAYWKPKLTSDTDTRYVDPEFMDEGPPSVVYDPSASKKTKTWSKRFSQFSFNYQMN